MSRRSMARVSGYGRKGQYERRLRQGPPSPASALGLAASPVEHWAVLDASPHVGELPGVDHPPRAQDHYDQTGPSADLDRKTLPGGWARSEDYPSLVTGLRFGRNVGRR